MSATAEAEMQDSQRRHDEVTLWWGMGLVVVYLAWLALGLLTHGGR